MKKKEEIIKSQHPISKEDLTERMLDVCLWYQVEETNVWIKTLENYIDLYKDYRDILIQIYDKSLFKTKLKNDIKELDAKINTQYESLKEEVKMIIKLKNLISSKDTKVEILKDDEFSYYDLLTFLKYGITFKKICYHKFEKDIVYIYDNEGNYILENKEDKCCNFCMYLSENASDNTKFEKNITIIEE